MFATKLQNVLVKSVISRGSKKGFTGKAFTDVVNIGIGGSDLGPANDHRSASILPEPSPGEHSLRQQCRWGPRPRDPWQDLNPETTLFIVVSKSFTTQETLTNALTIKKWFLQQATLLKRISPPTLPPYPQIQRKYHEFGIDSRPMYFPCGIG